MASNQQDMLKAVRTWGNDTFAKKPVSITENAGNTEKEYKLDITVGEDKYTTPNLKGKQGAKGDRGDDGYPFLIYKEYASLSDFNSDDFPKIGLMFIVKELDENDAFPVYRYTGEGENPYSYITGLSDAEAIKGNKGDKGDTYIPVVGTVTDSEEPTVEIDIDENKKEAKFNFGLVSGKTPYVGENGNWWYGDEDSGIPIPSFLDLLKYVDTNYGIQDTPIGHILTHMGTSAPNHYLICDGTEYQIADYPYLAQHFIDNFESVNFFGGDGETTFAVPDLRGEFLRGSGTANRNTGSGGSVGTHQNPTNQTTMSIFAENRLGITRANNEVGVKLYANPDSEKYAPNSYQRRYNLYNITPQPNSTAYEYTTRPTNTAVLYCVKYEPTYFLQIVNNENSTNSEMT